MHEPPNQLLLRRQPTAYHTTSSKLKSIPKFKPHYLDRKQHLKPRSSLHLGTPVFPTARPVTFTETPRSTGPGGRERRAPRP